MTKVRRVGAARWNQAISVRVVCVELHTVRHEPSHPAWFSGCADRHLIEELKRPERALVNSVCVQQGSWFRPSTTVFFGLAFLSAGMYVYNQISTHLDSTKNAKLMEH